MEISYFYRFYLFYSFPCSFTLLPIDSHCICHPIWDDSFLRHYEAIRHQTAYMKTVHGVLLHPGFLISGAYLGVYGVFLLFRPLIAD